MFGDILLCITEVHGVFVLQSSGTKDSGTEAQSFWNNYMINGLLVLN